MEDSNQQIQLPTGFRFLPTDEELVLHYLQRKITGESVPAGLIPEFNLYSDKNPWEILNKNYTGYFHVFTKLQNLSKQKVGRRAGSGTWKGESTKPICDDQGNLLWFKKAFVFEIDENKINSTDVDCGHWLMTEFSLPGVENYVVCKIYNKEGGEATTTKSMRSKKRKLQRNTNSACAGSWKKKKSEYVTSSVVPVPQDHNDLTLTVVPEPEPQPEIQNNVQMDPEPEALQQSTEADEEAFYKLVFSEDYNNNINDEDQTSSVPQPVKQSTEQEKLMASDIALPIEDIVPISDLTALLSDDSWPLEDNNKDDAMEFDDLPLDQFPPLDYDYP